MSTRLLTPAQVAERLQVTEHTIYDWLRKGKLRGFKVGRLWRIPQANLDAFLQEDEFDAPLTEDEIAASESAWQAYLDGKDRGETLAQVRSELLQARHA